MAHRLGLAFLDVDQHLADRVADIGEFINRHGYHVYARENVDTYCSLEREGRTPGVVALSSGFMNYARDFHPAYSRICRQIEQHPNTFVLLPSLNREVCIAETVRRQIARRFGRSAAKEEAVIRSRFGIYMAVPARKVESLRPPSEVVD
jgi:shikimate kinase